MRVGQRRSLQIVTAVAGLLAATVLAPSRAEAYGYYGGYYGRGYGYGYGFGFRPYGFYPAFIPRPYFYPRAYYVAPPVVYVPRPVYVVPPVYGSPVVLQTPPPVRRARPVVHRAPVRCNCPPVAAPTAAPGSYNPLLQPGSPLSGPPIPAPSGPRNNVYPPESAAPAKGLGD